MDRSSATSWTLKRGLRVSRSERRARSRQEAQSASGPHPSQPQMSSATGRSPERAARVAARQAIHSPEYIDSCGKSRRDERQFRRIKEQHGYERAINAIKHYLGK